MATVGVHCILELHDCAAEKLNDLSFISRVLKVAADHAGSTLLNEVAHQFEPHGVTALGLLAESHISLHTWPEHGYVAADIFTCGETATPDRACEYLVDAFEAKSHSLRKIDRGMMAAPDRRRSTPVADSKEGPPWQVPRYVPISG